MSYLVLARKFRPQTFDEVVAQQHITDTLKNAIEKDRLAHAYLFCGPRGTGKTTTARIVAKCLNCQSFDSPTATPCGTCQSCVSIAQGNSPDVYEIDGASNRGIAEIQSLRESVQYAPQGRNKVYIIDEVHMLTKEAFNALLKTLEEPPRYVTFIFATTEPQKLPATIISRCQRYDFRRIPGNRIAEHIAQLAENEGLKLDSDASALIAHRADGGLRDSLSLLDQILAYSPKGELSADEVARILGILPLDAFDKIAEQILERNPVGALHELDRLLESGIDIAQVGDGLSEHFHGALKFSIGAEKEDLGEKEKEIYSRIADEFPPEDLLRISKILVDMQSRLKYAAQPRYLFEESLIYLTNLETTASIRRAISRIDSGEYTAPRRASAPKASAPMDDDEEPAEPEDNSPKGRLVREFSAKRGEGKADWVSESEVILDEGRIILKFPHKYEYQVTNILNIKENLDALREAAEKVYGPNTAVKLIVEDSSEKQTTEKESGNGVPTQVMGLLEKFDAKLD